MATLLLTTAGITKPSTTTLGYANSNVVSQPPLGGADISSEMTTVQYAAASALDGSYVTENSTSNYGGVEVKLQIPSASRGNTWTGLAYGVSALCGYEGGPGFVWYIRNNATSAWELISSTPNSTLTTLTSSKASAIGNYIDGNYRISLLVLTRVAYDPNFTFASLSVDYIYATLTYVGAAPRRRRRVSYY